MNFQTEKLKGDLRRIKSRDYEKADVLDTLNRMAFVGCIAVFVSSLLMGVMALGLIPVIGAWWLLFPLVTIVSMGCAIYGVDYDSDPDHPSFKRFRDWDFEEAKADCGYVLSFVWMRKLKDRNLWVFLRDIVICGATLLMALGLGIGTIITVSLSITGGFLWWFPFIWIGFVVMIFLLRYIDIK